MYTPERKAFKIPMTGAFVSHRRESDGQTVVHALDFDLVAVDPDCETAFQKIRLAVKTYVEYGVSNNWVDDICFPAPVGYWEPFRKASSMNSMAPISIEDDRQMIVVHAAISPNEYRQVACQA